MRKKIPVFTGIPGIVENGAVGTVGTNYYELGKVNAAQITQILKGKAASDIPVQSADRGDIYLNLVPARELGIDIPDDLKKQAFKVYE
jgi:putative tryptophan/tyrosine transport system substrate-binding protein